MNKKALITGQEDSYLAEPLLNKDCVAHFSIDGGVFGKD
jgi:GDP-D-mannose dehydratase